MANSALFCLLLFGGMDERTLGAFAFSLSVMALVVPSDILRAHKARKQEKKERILPQNVIEARAREWADARYLAKHPISNVLSSPLQLKLSEGVGVGRGSLMFLGKGSVIKKRAKVLRSQRLFRVRVSGPAGMKDEFYLFPFDDAIFVPLDGGDDRVAGGGGFRFWLSAADLLT